jgi:hypothetical protein
VIPGRKLAKGEKAGEKSRSHCPLPPRPTSYPGRLPMSGLREKTIEMLTTAGIEPAIS